MIQMMKSSIGSSLAARGARQQQAWMLRKAAGFVIVSSGLAVIVVQARQHALGA
ncbi:MAG: hypothetical protein QOC89_3374 [Paraburkholderia sp.]|uniref:hypothetical protein n=1 Tax=Paraburkholderia sp. TaxID=1926495 RepID=UPI002AFE5953|nr:hypothetical protein [Paraburkholderia sp.]MEA3085677.1 hypothetical protein [Paraburkholderia sp.]